MTDNIVYHYCSTEAFVKIISGKSIRLSDITKSNDSMEVLWITRFIKDIFNEEFDKEAANTQYFKNGYSREDFSKSVKFYSDNYFKEDQRLYSYLVCCFSKAGDLLSQWRGYADDAKGLSIGFDAEALSLLGEPLKKDAVGFNEFDFSDVVYSEHSQKQKIRKCAKDLINELKPLVKGSLMDTKQKSLDAFNRCFLQLFKLSIFMKNPFFKEEKEWRIYYCTDLNSKYNVSNIHIGNGLSLSNIGHYARRNNVTPFVDLSFGKSNIEVIKEIIIGPKCAASKKDIETYLRINGINNCSVKESKGTYR